MSEGNANDVNTWSNVPYFIVQGLKENGHNVLTVDMRIKYVAVLYNLVVTKPLLYLFRKSLYSYDRSLLKNILYNWKLKSIAKNTQGTDLYLSMVDGNLYKYTNKKYIYLVDWTFEYEVIQDYKKNIDFLERGFITRQEKMMMNASINIIMRESCKEFVLNKYRKMTIYGPKTNVINSLLIEPIKFSFKDTNNVVFLGAPRYLKGATQLLKISEKILSIDSSINIYFIGITLVDVGLQLSYNDRIHFCGYLDKGLEQEKNLYYKIICGAKVCVNTNEGFVSIASLMEASYLGKPVIVSRHHQTLSMYGENSNCVFYCDGTNEDLYELILYLYQQNMEEYGVLCERCREQFKNSTWSEFLKGILSSPLL